MDQRVPAPTQLIPGAGSRDGRPGENDEREHGVQALTPGRSPRRLCQGLRTGGYQPVPVTSDPVATAGPFRVATGRAAPRPPGCSPRAGRSPPRRGRRSGAAAEPPRRGRVRDRSPTNPTRRLLGSTVPETDSRRRSPKPDRGSWLRCPDQVHEAVVHLDTGGDTLDREPSTVGHRDGLGGSVTGLPRRVAVSSTCSSRSATSCAACGGVRRATASSARSVIRPPGAPPPPLPASSSDDSAGSDPDKAGRLPLAWTPKAASFIAHPRNDLPPAGGNEPVRAGGGLGWPCYCCRNPLRLFESI